MIACRACNDTLPAFFLAKMSHLVVSTSELEGKDWKQIFTLQHDGSLQSVAKVDSVGEFGLLDNIIYFRGGDQADILRFDQYGD